MPVIAMAGVAALVGTIGVTAALVRAMGSAPHERPQPWLVSAPGPGVGVAHDEPGSQPAADLANPADAAAPVSPAAGVDLGPAAFAGWASRTSISSGVPARALEAYAAATTRVDAGGGSGSACALSWPTLAAIGFVESANGEIGGGLTDSGRARSPIVGVDLNGLGGVARVADTDGGVLDGSAQLDRAVGPLQFLPSTWRTWGADGDGDGVRDPQDIDDAALAAARYLCASGDLATAAGWSGAILAYNHSEPYLRAVFTAADAYATRSES